MSIIKRSYKNIHFNTTQATNLITSIVHSNNWKTKRTKKTISFSGTLKGRDENETNADAKERFSAITRWFRILLAARSVSGRKSVRSSGRGRELLRAVARDCSSILSSCEYFTLAACLLCHVWRSKIALNHF